MRSLIMIIFIVFTANIYSQSTNDLLNQKIGTLKIENFNQLQDSGLISKMDMTLLSMYMVRMQQNGVPFDNLTFRQILDSLEVFKQKMNAEISASANFGTDSVFLRTPNQEKVFIGMGQLSLEKLVERESKKLPQNYNDKRLNTYFTNVNQLVQIIKNLNLDDQTAILLGNTILIMTENGNQLTDFKIGDFLEISNRIKNSKEFKPFLGKMN